MIQSWKELASDEFSEGRDGVREFRRHFLAIADNQFETHESIKSDPRCPQRWELHPEDPIARCVSRRVSQQKKNRNYFDVECFYTSDIFDTVENPLERPAVIDWSTVEYAVATPVDLDGKPLTTTTGEPLTDIMIEAPGLVADISVLVPDKPAWFRRYNNVVNEGAFRFDGETFDKGELRVKSLSCSGFRYEQNFRFRELRISLQSRDDGWQKRVINRGFYELAERQNGSGETTYEHRQIKIEGVPAVEPQLLTEDGKHLQLVTNGQLDPEKFPEVFVLDFKVRHERPFSVFPINS